MFSFFYELNPALQAFIACMFTFLITALGSASVFFFKKFNKTLLDSFLSISAGVMIAASFFSLINPAIEMSENLNLIPSIVLTIGILGGTLLLFIGDKIFEKKIKVSNNKKRISLLFFSIMLHNIPEGMAIGVAFGSVIYGLNGATIGAAISLAIGIGIQNFPEGSAISLPLVSSGVNKKKAFLIGAVSAIVEPIAGIIGASLVLKMSIVLPYLLAFAAGAMLYVVVEEIIPESQNSEKKDLMAFITLIGFSLMMILDIALG
ncbi:MAG: ZIP family metal transporter [Bacilli bacterium]|nr:ZIP family metal transporter [Bacilli bacterium]